MDPNYDPEDDMPLLALIRQQQQQKKKKQKKEKDLVGQTSEIVSDILHRLPEGVTLHGILPYCSIVDQAKVSVTDQKFHNRLLVQHQPALTELLLDWHCQGIFGRGFQVPEDAKRKAKWEIETRKQIDRLCDLAQQPEYKKLPLADFGQAVLFVALNAERIKGRTRKLTIVGLPNFCLPDVGTPMCLLGLASPTLTDLEYNAWDEYRTQFHPYTFSSPQKSESFYRLLFQPQLVRLILHGTPIQSLHAPMDRITNMTELKELDLGEESLVLEQGKWPWKHLESLKCWSIQTAPGFWTTLKEAPRLTKLSIHAAENVFRDTAGLTTWLDFVSPKIIEVKLGGRFHELKFKLTPQWMRDKTVQLWIDAGPEQRTPAYFQSVLDQSYETKNAMKMAERVIEYGNQRQQIEKCWQTLLKCRRLQVLGFPIPRQTIQELNARIEVLRRGTAEQIRNLFQVENRFAVPMEKQEIDVQFGYINELLSRLPDLEYWAIGDSDDNTMAIHPRAVYSAVTKTQHRNLRHVQFTRPPLMALVSNLDWLKVPEDYKLLQQVRAQFVYLPIGDDLPGARLKLPLNVSDRLCWFNTVSLGSSLTIVPSWLQTLRHLRGFIHDDIDYSTKSLVSGNELLTALSQCPALEFVVARHLESYSSASFRQLVGQCRNLRVLLLESPASIRNYTTKAEKYRDRLSLTLADLDFAVDQCSELRVLRFYKYAADSLFFKCLDIGWEEAWNHWKRTTRWQHEGRSISFFAKFENSPEAYHRKNKEDPFDSTTNRIKPPEWIFSSKFDFRMRRF